MNRSRTTLSTADCITSCGISMLNWGGVRMAAGDFPSAFFAAVFTSSRTRQTSFRRAPNFSEYLSMVTSSKRSTSSMNSFSQASLSSSAIRARILFRASLYSDVSFGFPLYVSVRSAARLSSMCILCTSFWMLPGTFR